MAHLIHQLMTLNTRFQEDFMTAPNHPTLKNLWAILVSFGMNEFSLMVNYQDDFGVNADLKIAAVKAKLDLGGSFENHVATSLLTFNSKSACSARQCCASSYKVCSIKRIETLNSLLHHGVPIIQIQKFIRPNKR